MRVSEAINSRRSMRVFKADPGASPISNGSFRPRGVERQPAAVEALRHHGQGAAAAVGCDLEGDGMVIMAWAPNTTSIPRPCTTRAASSSASNSTPCSACRGRCRRRQAVPQELRFLRRAGHPVRQVAHGHGEWIDCGIFLDQRPTRRWRARRACIPARRRPSAATSTSCAASGRRRGGRDLRPGAGLRPIPTNCNNLITERAQLQGLHDLVRRCRDQRRRGTKVELPRWPARAKTRAIRNKASGRNRWPMN